ncbi:amino acid ABC transporter substrate-binding protein [Aphanothece hegewaldii CCALA 016]|uniref:Amino acid ABC transporter substrate-binding protein n=1 Tax=Aphanothece hegewaldii CCALA 016 TaxID=2107694 RepID=A0A2T1LRQ6_9CHRO|nr:transporter substrate-binding domain-containing protein [Aphanothece hegewaldii]PSF31685.1 amino acid ABC transporter substrate-binding protein [Aphanothece hegewaldii CCALA 016]
MQLNHWSRKIKKFGGIWVLICFFNYPVQAQVPIPLRVATKSFAPLAFEQNGQYTGFSIELWKEIAQELSIEYEIYEEPTIIALLNSVTVGTTDVAVAGITITSEREEKIDFSYSFFESGLQILVLNQSSSSIFSVFSFLFSPILLQALCFILVSILIAAHLIWYFERQKNSDMFPKDYKQGILEASWWAVVTVVTVGYGDKVPKDMPGRIIAAIWMFSGVLLISYFTASITSVLTVQQLKTDINKFTDLIGKQVATVKGTTAAAYLANRPVGLLEFDTIEEAFKALEERKANAIVYDAPVLLYYANGEGAGKVKTVGAIFQKQSYGIALKQDSIYRERINQALLTLKEKGVYDQLYEKWFGQTN